MQAWVSWAIFLAIIGGGYFYYSSRSSNRSRQQRGRSTQRATTTGLGKTDAQWLDSDTKPATKAAKAAKTARKSVKKAVQDVGEKAKATLSAASSTTGADADDDLSPAVSPALGATTVAKAPSGRDVSDMLESSAPAPSVLRLTPTEKSVKASKPQPQRSESAQETKKQRQNREKKEREKIQRAEDEKQRKTLEEKQRRTARISRGEPAKNGIPVPQAPTSNPWLGNRSSNGTSAPAVQSSGQLLDTFDPDVASTASSSEIATNGTAPTSDSLSGSAHWTNLPSEEEQLRLAMEDSAWTTVPKGKKQKKNKAESATSDETSDSGAPQQAAPAPPVKQVPAKKPENMRAGSGFEVLAESTPNVGHPMDSDWTVA
ncbi:hypothetical protein BDV96DRAFT_595281 [Lophiotrema nucula]|uniref:Uncharacterized protein n=1 Tax=Lophiotrema nucula TaxID=690887 RepID=A0A6A5ZNR7_9PLEO|nr:hypothetical protein BDV96DRAFT_595281 [Lophiotrema nucula]